MAAPKGHIAYSGSGRPLTYTKEIVDKIAEKLDAWIKEKENLFIQKFCFENDINHRKIGEFKEISQKFREVYDKLDAKQIYSLFEGGLKKKYAYPMCALVLSNNHNIVAKTEQKLVGSVSNPLEFIVTNIDGNTKDLVSE